MDKDKLVELAERCEAATGPDRALDAEIAAAFHVKQLTYQSPEWIKDPEFTASIDAAMTLVPEGYFWTGGSHPEFGAGMVVTDNPDAELNASRAATPALALCAAALRSHAQPK